MAQRSLTVKIIGDAASYEKALRKSQSTTRDFDKQLSITATSSRAFSKSLAFAATSLLGGAGFVGAATKAVNAASDLEEQLSKTDVVFGKSGKTVQEWSKTTASSLGIARDKALEATGTFGAMLVPMGFAREKAADMSVTMVKLASDMASFNNASPEETLNALRSGLAGETEPLRRFGVFLNDARVKQEALNLGLYNGKGNLDAAGKAAATYSIILRDTKDAQGDFARTGDGLANQQRKLSALLRDTEASIGKALLPTVTKMTAAVTGWLGKTENQEKIQNAANKTIKVAGDIVDAVWPKLQQMGKAADGVAQAVGGWDKALMLITGGLLFNKVTSLAGAFAGNTGLTGSVLRATQQIAGKGGLLTALRAIPPLIGVAVVVSAIIPEDLKVAGKDILKKGGLGGVANLPVVGDLAAAAAAGGQALGRAAGLDYTDSGGYKVGSAENDAYMRGIAGKSLTADELGNPAVVNAYAAGRRAAGTNRATAPTVTQSGSQNIRVPAVNDYSATSFNGMGGSGGGGGGGSSAASRRAAEDKAAARQAALEARLFLASMKLFPNGQAGPMSGFSADTIAADRASREDAARAVKDRIDAMRAAVDSKRGEFASSYSRLGDSAQKAIEAKYAAMQKALATALQSQLAAIEKARAELTPAEAELAQVQDARAEQDRAEALAAAQASGDAKAIEAAQYQIRIAALQKRAQAERTAKDQQAREQADAAQNLYNTEKERLDNELTAEKTAYTDKLAALSDYLRDRATSVAEANKLIKSALGEFASDLDRQIEETAGKLHNVYVAAASATGPLAPGATTAGEALRTAFPRFRAMATGGDMLVTEPTLFLAGEAGPERATFSPVGGRNYHGAGVAEVHSHVYLDGRQIGYTVRREIIRGAQAGASTNVITRSRTGV